MEQQNAGAPAARPTFLTVLCILSFIAQGFAAIGYIIVALGLGVVSAVATSDAVNNALDSMSANMTAEENAAMDAVSTAGSASMGLAWAYIIVGLLCTIICFVGVLKMWKLQKSGFFMYAGASALSIIMGIIYSGMDGLMMGTIVPVAFIVMYGLNLKHMK
jgi:uncharacterized integral membrane protein